MLRFALYLFLAPLALAQEPEPATPPVVEAEAPAIDDGTRVSVLGYHEFSETRDPNQMLIRTSEFRSQMHALKALNIPIITLDQFLQWKRGSATLPPRSVLLTIDDGWKSTYTDAFPILKEYGFPFTIFPYKNYVDGGGRALTTPMIKEMQKHGCTIGSHSVSHPLPSAFKKAAAKGPEAAEAFIRTELEESRKFLKAKFGEAVTTFAYPGGYFTEEMPTIGDTLGYEFYFTISPGKIKQGTSNHKLPRYIVHGIFDKNFAAATRFHANANAEASLGFQSTPHPVSPEAGGTVQSRLPTIWADLSAIENLDHTSPTMRVAGFGLVPAKYDRQTRRLSWTVNRRLRQRITEVSVQWSLLNSSKPETPMNWRFLIDREAAYQAGAGE